MVGVKVSEEHLGQGEAHPVAQHLALRPLAALEQQRLTFAHQRERGDVALYCRPGGGRPKESDGEHGENMAARTARAAWRGSRGEYPGVLAAPAAFAAPYRRLGFRITAGTLPHCSAVSTARALASASSIFARPPCKCGRKRPNTTPGSGFGPARSSTACSESPTTFRAASSVSDIPWSRVTWSAVRPTESFNPMMMLTGFGIAASSRAAKSSILARPPPVPP